MVKYFDKNMWKIVIASFVMFCFFSCSNSEIDKLLNDAETLINRYNVETLKSQTNFESIIDELDKKSENMSAYQLNKYLSILTKVVEATKNSNVSFNFKFMSNSPYIGSRPEYSFYDDLETITTNTKDTVNHNIIVKIVIGFDKDDNNSINEFNSKKMQIQDFLKNYFSEKYASDLSPDKESHIRREIMENLNIRFLETARVRTILFNQLDVLEDI